MKVQVSGARASRSALVLIWVTSSPGDFTVTSTDAAAVSTRLDALRFATEGATAVQLELEGPGGSTTLQVTAHAHTQSVMV